MKGLRYKNILKSSIITAFTLVVAFLWKDVIIELIELFVPKSEEIYFKFLVAIAGTILAFAGIYVMLQTEYEAELVMNKIKDKSKKVELKKKD